MIITNDLSCSEMLKCWHFHIFEQNKFELSMKSFIYLGPEHCIVFSFHEYWCSHIGSASVLVVKYLFYSFAIEYYIFICY